MPITILRWKSGYAGDTILKLILDSDPTLNSQVRYVGLNDSKTVIDNEFVSNFPFTEITKMSLTEIDIDLERLNVQLQELYQLDTQKSWILKTHIYNNKFDCFLDLIDITITVDTLPFVIKASLEKNSREKKLLPNYHQLCVKIKNPEILYKFDCYNFIKDRIQPRTLSNKQICLNDFLKGWDYFVYSVRQVGLNVSDNGKEYYTNWIDQNKKFLPTNTYLTMVSKQDYDYTNPDLTIEERYCLLVLSGSSFKILQ